MNKYDKGFISLYRQFKNWRYYKNDNIKSVFIHCLLSAYWKDEVINEYHGKKINPPITVPKGSFITSRGKLAQELSKTDGEIRYALEALSTTKCRDNNYDNDYDNEITIVTTKLYTVISISNFNSFQGFIKNLQPSDFCSFNQEKNQHIDQNLQPQLNNIYLNKDKKDIKDIKDKSTDVHSLNLNSLTLKLLKTHYIEEIDIPEVYNEMFNEFLADYEYNHINVVLSYILRKVKNKTIRHKYSYLKKSLSINLEKMNEIMNEDDDEEIKPVKVNESKLCDLLDRLEKGELT